MKISEWYFEKEKTRTAMMLMVEMHNRVNSNVSSIADVVLSSFCELNAWTSDLY